MHAQLGSVRSEEIMQRTLILRARHLRHPLLGPLYTISESFPRLSKAARFDVSQVGKVEVALK